MDPEVRLMLMGPLKNNISLAANPLYNIVCPIKDKNKTKS